MGHDERGGLDDHVEELASELDVDEAEVRSDLEKLVSYDVPIDEATQSLRRKYGRGGGGGGNGEPSATDIEEITTESGSVTVTARVLTVGKRSIRYEGEEETIFEGELADETGTISYTAWTDVGLSPGDTVTAGNVDVREWEGEPELNINERTTVTFEDEPLEVDAEIGGDRDLVDMTPGDRGRNVEVRVIDVERRTIDGRSGETEILSGVIGDETGRLPFTDWDPHDAIEEGASLRLEDVYVREFRGMPSVNVSKFSRVAPLDRTVDVRESATRMTVSEAVETGGAFDVELVGDLIAVRDGSGLIQRCPECGRVVQKGQCRTHGDVEGVDDLRVKAILDDGTGTVTVVLDDELTAAVYGGDLEDALEHARDEMDQSVVAETIRERIVGREFVVRGSLSVDEYGANLNADEFEAATGDPAERARTLLAEVEG